MDTNTCDTLNFEVDFGLATVKNYQSTRQISNSHNSVMRKVFWSWENLRVAGPNILEYLAGFWKV